MQSSATRQSPSSSPWGTDHHSRQLGAILNSPAGLPMQPPALNGPMASPFLFPRDSSDGGGSGGSATSANYFGLPMDNTSNPPGSNPGPHTKRNWDTLTQPYSSVPSPRLHRVSPNPAQKHILSLVRSDSHAVQEDASRIRDHATDVPAVKRSGTRTNRDASVLLGRIAKTGGDSESRNSGMDIDEYPPSVDASQRGPSTNQGMNIEFPKTYSPSTYQSTTSSPIPRPSLSLPPGATHTPSPNRNKSDHRRADTLPTTLDQVPVSFITAEMCEQLLQTVSQTTLLLDIRPYPQFSQANIMDSLNLCIPTTLLKRPSFNTDKLRDTFANEDEKRKFSSWRENTYIIVYDSNTEQPRDATQLINVLKKFKVEGWLGEAKILRGGFAAFSSRFPNRIRQQRQSKLNPSSMQSRSMSLSLPSTLPVAGGCSLPEVPASEPFFGNIRQNMDLVGGVGQIPVKLPDDLTPNRNGNLPSWLREASAYEDKGRNVSQKFLNIEERELHRMREALNSNANYNETSSKFRVAGIEKGSKNRYNDIYPFDHTRVRLQDIPSGGCDYVNGNYLKAKLTNKSYIATQAPIPDTFDVSTYHRSFHPFRISNSLLHFRIFGVSFGSKMSA
jgi:tyrosine-protein phosphatase 2/3